MSKFTPCLWFDGRAEEAMEFYTTVFKDSQKAGFTHYGDKGPGPKGSVMTASFTLFGQDFLALNGGPMFQFTPAISLIVNCDDQAEIDHYWDKLSEGGETQVCGWLKDKFGVSWQIVPKDLGELTLSATPAQRERIMSAVMQMKKLDAAAIRQAFESARAA
jgi:predicted 3-demethylubiquinone-9 3-methyltransferase (glyoxalase superfamily)